jgi:HSP20 family protein
MFGIMRRRPEEWTETGLWGNNPFALLRNEMGRIFDRFAEEAPVAREFFEIPAWETEETENALILRVPLAGFAVEEINLTVLNNRLTVRAEHGAPAKEGETPREHRRIERTVLLPEGIDFEHIESTYRNGLLEVRLPRLPEATPRAIPVRT